MKQTISQYETENQQLKQSLNLVIATVKESQ